MTAPAELTGRSADRVRELCLEIHRAGKSESALGSLAALVLSEFPPRERITTGLMPLVELCHVASGRSDLDRCDRVFGHGGTHTWESPLVPPF